MENSTALLKKFSSNPKQLNLNCNRRGFLRKVINAAATLAVAPILGSSIIPPETFGNKPRTDAPPSETSRIHPDIQLYCLQNGHVELRTSPKSASKVSHIYKNDFEVEVLLLLASNKSIDVRMNELANKHSLSTSICKNRVDKLMNDLNSKGLICHDHLAITANTTVLSA